MANFAVILAAAGKSVRFKDKNYRKPFAPLDNRAVWLHSAERFLNRTDVKQTIIVISADDQDYFEFKFASNVVILGIDVVFGGKERADSIENALAKVRSDIDFVCVHDAARPCLANEWIDAVFSEAEKSSAAILAIPVGGTLKRAGTDRQILETVPRKDIWEAQTPQVFSRQILLDAYAKRNGFAATDDAQLVERAGHPVQIVPGSPINIKITTKEDLRLASLTLKAIPKPRLSGGTGNPFADGDMWR